MISVPTLTTCCILPNKSTVKILDHLHKTVLIQICWLLKKPADQDPHCFPSTWWLTMRKHRWIDTVNSEIFSRTYFQNSQLMHDSPISVSDILRENWLREIARALFLWNFAYAKFCENKTLAKISEFTVESKQPFFCFVWGFTSQWTAICYSDQHW